MIIDQSLVVSSPDHTTQTQQQQQEEEEERDRESTYSLSHQNYRTDYMHVLNACMLIRISKDSLIDGLTCIIPNIKS